MEDMIYDDIQNFFCSIAVVGRTLFAESLTLSYTYPWYPKSINELLPGVILSFLVQFSSYAALINNGMFKTIICALQEAASVDIRITRSISPGCFAILLATVVDRMTTSSFPMELISNNFPITHILSRRSYWKKFCAGSD
jgi:hypothetical protein